MEQNENVDAEYLRGFNDGYLLAKHQPDISKAIDSLKGNAERIQGIKDGMQEYSKELLAEKKPDWLKKDRVFKVKEDIEKNKKDIERD